MKARYKKILKYSALTFFGLGMLCVLGGAGVAGYLYWDAVRSLPDIKKITDYTPPLVTTVYANDNEVLGYFYKEKRFLKRLPEMPEHLPLAFLAAEDDSFYQHEGVDPTAIFRALIKNMQAGQVVQGGSTITQQVIKSMLLTPEKSYERKIKEAILAYRLESYLTKDEILTIYLNQIFFGNHAYGVEAAARTYFGKHVMDLTIAEAAMLGGLPKAPSAYNPFNNPEAARNRQMYVLGRMRALDWIDEAAYEEAVNQEMDYRSMPDPSWGTGAYYLEEVRRRLIDRFGEEMVYTKGLQVQTAMDY
jgi:penicillin-binding protein 1A